MASDVPFLAGEKEEEKEDDTKEKCISMVVKPVLMQYVVVMLLTISVGVVAWYVRKYMGLEVVYHGLRMSHYVFFWEALACVAAVIAVINAVMHSLQHFKYSSAGSDLHLCTQVILWVVPVYGTCSLVAFAAEVSETHFSVLYNAMRESYEAVVLVFFMLFVAEYLGGLNALAQKLAREEVVIGKVLPEKVCDKLRGISICGKHVLDLRPFPYKRAPGSEFVFCIFMSILQYAFVILGLLVTKFTLWFVFTRLGEEKPEHIGLLLDVLKVVKLASNGWALFNLLVLYEYLIEAQHTKERMEKINPHSKFWCIKLIVLFSLWQENIFESLAKLQYLPEMHGWEEGVVWENDTEAGQKRLADGAVNFLVCLEMVLFAQWHRFAYPYDESLMDGAEEDAEGKRGLKAFFRDLFALKHKAKKSREAIRHLRRGESSDSMQKAFQSFDVDQDGNVCVSQLVFLLDEGGDMSLMEAREVMTNADLDKSGSLSWREFKDACDKYNDDQTPEQEDAPPADVA